MISAQELKGLPPAHGGCTCPCHRTPGIMHVAPCCKPKAAEEPDFATSIAEVMKEEALGGAACGWRSCTGCHETNEGYETGHYPYSAMFKAYVGSGCGECGGLGVVWEYWSESDLAAMAEDPKPAAIAPERLWLSAADADNEHEVWFDPDEGGTPYLRADLALPDIEAIIEAVMEADRYAPKIVPMGANPPLFDGMQADNDGPWISRVDVAKRLRSALTGNRQ